MTKESRRLVLASASPRRRELLGSVIREFEIRHSGVPEETDPHLSPEQAALVVAARKSEAVAGNEDSALVLGADTIVVINGQILGKPDDEDAARAMLRLLRGQWHAVITGLAVTDTLSGNAMMSAVSTQVKMLDFDDSAMEAYIATGEPMDKAGSYAVQGRGGELIEAVRGCYNNVVGLPLCETASLLAEFGLRINSGNAVCRLPNGAPCPRLKM